MPSGTGTENDDGNAHWQRSATPPWLALELEVEGCARLFRAADESLASFRWQVDAEPLLALLATAAEKLLKLTYGSLIVAKDGQWPDRTVMSKELSHQVVELDQRCRGLIAAREHLSTVPGYIADLRAAVDADEYLAALLQVLDSYARNGRFHNLDTLAGSEPPTPAPRQLWEEAPRQLWEDMESEHLDRHRGWTKLGPDNGDMTEVREMLTRHLLDSLRGWRELYVRAWLTGVCGPQAQHHGPTLVTYLTDPDRR